MKTEEKAPRQKRHHRKHDGVRIWSRLLVRMTISYVAVSVTIALLLELLLVGIFFLVIERSPLFDQSTVSVVKCTAQFYALEAAVQARGTSLDPRSTFQPGQPSSLASPQGCSTSQVAEDFALLIASNGLVLASSDPARYPVSAPVAHLLPNQAQLIRKALTGTAGSMVEINSQGHVASVAQPVETREKQTIGAIYVQLKPAGFTGNIFSFATGFLFTALFWLVVTSPIGAIAAVLVTRGLVRRLRRLIKATAQFANGDYSQRVEVARRDEIGQLESQFNSMAEQLVESIAQQRTLVEEQARLEERARIEQELHTAELIQRSLLPKDLPALKGWKIATYYQAAREVGGDLYDFLPFEDGRLGLVIGDVSGKGMPAALVMASTRSMLRAAAQSMDSPGEVLARVNDLLYIDTPPQIFATCFYAVLDPESGKLRYANAGHDLPYRWHSGSVGEVRATGMPLGLMPGMRYEEQEVIVAQNELILFYSDGLVEAHNSNREMFGFPRLQTLLAQHSNESALIDFLLNELKCFTGERWEQEDDMTLLTLQRLSEPRLMNQQYQKQAAVALSHQASGR